MEPGGVDRNAIHLAFDQDGVIQLANGIFGLIKIEQDARLRIDGGLRRVEVFVRLS